MSFTRRLVIGSERVHCRRLLSEYPTLTQASAGDRPVKHKVTHHIQTTGLPVFTRSRRLAPKRLRIARQEFDHMMELGIICPTSSSWSSPLHMVPKCTPGCWRQCRDYHSLNNATVPDRYPIPHLQDFTANLQGAKIFSGHTTKYQSSRRTFPKQLLPHLLGFLNSSGCHSVFGTPPKPSKGS